MGYTQPIMDTYTAGADLTDKENCLVSLGSSGVTLTTSATDTAVMGVVGAGAASGGTVSVWPLARGGRVQLKAGGSISAGNKLAATTGGAVAAASTAGNLIVAIAEEAAASGELFMATIVPTRLVPA